MTLEKRDYYAQLGGMVFLKGVGRVPREYVEKKTRELPSDMAGILAAVGFVPDAEQALLLHTREKRVILNCTRQWGKSSVTALKAVATALGTEGATVIAMSPSGRQSGEFLRKVEGYLYRLGFRNLKSDGVNRMSVELPNGSRVIALPGVEATMRGFSAVDLLIIDEAARVKDEQYAACLLYTSRSGACPSFRQLENRAFLDQLIEAPLKRGVPYRASNTPSTFLDQLIEAPLKPLRA